MKKGQCKRCKMMFPIYMLGKYKGVFLNPICPLCGLDLINKLSGKPKGTPFSDPDQLEVYLEAEEFYRENNKQNMGGHLINPPEDCPRSFRSKDGVRWTDLAICINCQIRCLRYIQFGRMTYKERREELRNNGIFLS